MTPSLLSLAIGKIEQNELSSIGIATCLERQLNSKTRWALNEQIPPRQFQKQKSHLLLKLQHHYQCRKESAGF